MNEVSEKLSDWLVGGELARLLKYEPAKRIKEFGKASEQIRQHYSGEHNALGEHFLRGTLFDAQRRFFVMWITGPSAKDCERATRALQVLALYGEDQKTNSIYRYINSRIFGLPLGKFQKMAEGSDEWGYEQRRFNWLNESEGWSWI